MTDKVIRVNVTASKSQKVTVSSSKVANEITASPDTSAYYSRLAKNWAIAEGLVENIDYSSKYYAQESKASADMAKTYETATQENYNMFMEASINANSELQTNRDGALADIEGAKTSAIDSLNSIKDENISTIESKANEALTNIETNRDETLSSIENSRSSSVSKITSLSNGYISQINTTGKSYDNLTHRNISNCITEIPQRIKLELANGVLTLKAGSIVTVPNGFEADGTTPKFDYVTIESDISATHSANVGLTYVYYIISSKSIGFSLPEETKSGESLNGNKAIFYNTSTNKVNYIVDGVVQDARSFPICLVQRTGVISSIDQVFNGMGYIGSTVWIDKGVKGLIPNGRNEDGSLRNIEFTADKIYMRTYAPDTSSSSREAILFSPFNPEYPYFTGSATKSYYITEDGYLYWGNRDAIIKGFVIGFMSRTNDKITEYILKTPFRAIDYSDKSEVSGWGMPSRYADITLGASGTKYTAPANGYYNLAYEAGTDCYVSLDANGLESSSWQSGNWSALFLPVKKGAVMTLKHRNLTIRYFRFIYAQGEVN